MTADENTNKQIDTRFLFPVIYGADNQGIINLARIISMNEPILLAGFIPIPEDESLSTGVLKALEMRKTIHGFADRLNIRAKSRIRVTHNPWQEVLQILNRTPCIDWLIINWPKQFRAFGLQASDILQNPPCNIALIKGDFHKKIAKIVVPMRGGPHIEEALRFGFIFSSVQDSTVTSVRVFKSESEKFRLDENFKGISRILNELSDIQQEKIVGRNLNHKIVEISNDYDLVILGTAAKPQADPHSFGAITDKILNQSKADVIAIKTRRFRKVGTPEFTSEAISVLVDRWFAENTFHCDEFSNISSLLQLKEEQGVSISLCLPALNEEKTIGKVLTIAKSSMLEEHPLLDEIIVMDSNSEDRTREIAEELGVKVYIHQDILPQYGSYCGKGDALWKSLFVSNGDLIVWVDSDIKNFHPRFIYGLIGPLLQRSNLNYVKGFYKRPIVNEKGIVEPARGGRVTELTSRPLINLFYSELSGVIQPLSGEYSGRRSVLENLLFTSGYGVETSLLIDIFEKYGLNSIGQVDLIERIHRNQPLQNLSRMSFAIIQVMLTRLEKRYSMIFLEDINKTLKTIHYGKNRMYLEVEEIADIERQPMITIPEYRKKFNK